MTSGSRHQCVDSAGELVSFTSVRINWPHGPEAFDRWARDQMTIRPMYRGASAGSISVARIWKKFETTFAVGWGLIEYEPVLEEYFYQMFAECWKVSHNGLGSGGADRMCRGRTASSTWRFGCSSSSGPSPLQMV